MFEASGQSPGHWWLCHMMHIHHSGIDKTRQDSIANPIGDFLVPNMGVSNALCFVLLCLAMGPDFALYIVVAYLKVSFLSVFAATSLLVQNVCCYADCMSTSRLSIRVFFHLSTNSTFKWVCLLML